MGEDRAPETIGIRRLKEFELEDAACLALGSLGPRPEVGFCSPNNHSFLSANSSHDKPSLSCFSRHKSVEQVPRSLQYSFL